MARIAGNMEKIMQENISKTVKINQTPEMIFGFFADLSRFSELGNVIPQDQISDIRASADECTFNVKGIGLGVKILEKTPFSMIKYMGIGQVPFEFLFWVQLKQVQPYDTRMRLVLHSKMNFAMKMMLKGKIQSGLDSAAERIADMFNGKIQPPTNTNIK